MLFWNRVKTLIKERNTTQEWIAGKVQVRADLFRRWASKSTMPNADQAVAIAQALGVTVEYLVTGSDSSDPWIRDNRAFIADCKLLSDAEFGTIVTTVRVMADAKRQAAQSNAG